MSNARLKRSFWREEEDENAMFRAMISALVIGLFASPMATAQTDMMDPLERGLYRSWSSTYGHLPPRLKRLDQAWSVTTGHRRMNASHDHIEAVHRQMCSISIETINAVWELVKKNNERPVKAKSVHVPERLTAYHAAAVAIGQTVHNNRDAKSCDDLTWDERLSLITAVRNFQTEYNRLNRYYSSPGHSQYKWSNSIGFEIPGLPLKLEILNGSLKLKLSTKSRFLNVDFQSGMSRVSAKSYNGLEYLAIYTPELKVYIFDVRDIDFDFPVAGHIYVTGSAMRYVCDDRCAEALDEMVEDAIKAAES